VLQFFNWQTRFDSTRTQRLLEGTDIRVPVLEDYAWRLWDFWERHLDPDLSLDRSLAGAVRGKVVLITGGSSGIGLAAAERCADAGATALIVARDPEKLEAARARLAERGAVHAYACDIADPAACDGLAKRVLAEHGGVDFLVNNAGRSIRRSIDLSYDRFHDFERTMQLNYFGAIRLVMALLPHMTERRSGHIVNVSSIGVQTNPPRFSANVASKAARDAFSRCSASELLEDGVRLTTVYMPLVRTEMIAPTSIYKAFPTLSPGEAADLVCEAILGQAKRVSTPLGVAGELAYAAAPEACDRVLAMAYRLFPDSAAAKGRKDARPQEEPELSSRAVAFAHLVPGVHW
jgi:NAD(P)-dependent dehydrogenase (short-subunit alcohol dehydrogenase family)